MRSDRLRSSWLRYFAECGDRKLFETEINLVLAFSTWCVSQKYEIRSTEIELNSGFVGYGGGDHKKIRSY